MSATLGQSAAPDHLRVEFHYGTTSEVAEIYREVAVTCIQQQVTRVMILIGDAQSEGERALRDAAKMIVLAGIVPGFRLALVAAAPRVAHTYRNAQRDLSAAGMRTELFESEEDAARWLGAGDGASRRAA